MIPLKIAGRNSSYYFDSISYLEYCVFNGSGVSLFRTSSIAASPFAALQFHETILESSKLQIPI